jgi:hypothetical protein
MTKGAVTARRGGFVICHSFFVTPSPLLRRHLPGAWAEEMKTYTANTNYTVLDRSPLTISTGDTVTVGPRDKSWEGWIWVSTEDGRGSYVPEEILEIAGASAVVKTSFSARDLSVQQGEKVTALREVKGWLWCRNAAGSEGWLPEFVLRASE